MYANWKHIYSGTDGDRPFRLEEYRDSESRALRVETTYGEPQILAQGIATVGLPVAADEMMRIEAETPAELHKELLENGFSPLVAAEITRHAQLP